MDERLPRRRFLTSLAGGLLATGASLRPAAGQDPLSVLKPGEIDRLRSDFNLNRERVRLLAVLSPT